MPVPPVLLEPAFDPLWRHVAAALDRRGLADRGWLALPSGLEPTVYARLGDVLGRAFPTTKRRVDLDALDRGLARHGADLLGLLRAAGHPPSGRAETRAAARAQRSATDAALDEAARERFGGETWVPGWVAAVRSTVADPEEARGAADAVARVLADAASGARSRGEVAARVLGGAHRLDRGTAARRWVRAALAHRAGDPDRDDPELWAAAGLPGDVVSAPVLTWGLPLLGDGVAVAVRALTAAGSPAPLTTLTLRDLEVRVPDGTVVLSTENPRVLEAAAQARLPAPVVCTAGHPTAAVLLLLDALLAAGAEVRHHGDLDPAGLGIAARLHQRGVRPWRMDAADHRAAVAAATADGVVLRAVEGPVPPTPWDPGLASELERTGLVVEEERVMDALLAEHAMCNLPVHEASG